MLGAGRVIGTITMIQILPTRAKTSTLTSTPTPQRARISWKGLRSLKQLPNTQDPVPQLRRLWTTGVHFARPGKPVSAQLSTSRSHLHTVTSTVEAGDVFVMLWLGEFTLPRGQVILVLRYFPTFQISTHIWAWSAWVKGHISGFPQKY